MATGGGEPDDLLQVAWLYHVGQLSQEEVSRRLGMSRFKVLRHIRIPALLLEAGFLNDPAEGQRIGTPQYRQQLGIAIAQGVQNYNSAVNYRTPNSTFAVVRATLPPHARSITEPLDEAPPVQPAPPQQPSVTIGGGE